MRSRGRPRPASNRLARAAAVALALSAFPGCSAFQGAADRGQRILETPGLRPGKLFAVVGAVPGAALGVPFTAILVPTLPFPKLTYSASPTHDISMPILFAPLDYGIGLGAFIFSSPFLIFNRDLGTTREPTEWPPDRHQEPATSPGLSGARSVEMVYPPPAPANPPPIPPEGPIPAPKSPVSTAPIPTDGSAAPAPPVPPEGTPAVPPPPPPVPPEGTTKPPPPPPPEAGPKG